MGESVEMTIGTSLVLDEVVRKLMYSVKEENGQEVVVDRKIPFRLRYRLNKNKIMLDKDVEWFNNQRMYLFAKYGEPAEDGKSVEIKDEAKLELYRKEISNLIDTKVTHDLVTLEISDIELVEDPDIAVSPEAMTMFIRYLTDDPALEEDLKAKITPKEIEQEVKEEVKEEEPKVVKTKKTTKKSSKKES